MAKKAWKDLEGQYFRIDVGSTEAEALASEESNVIHITTEQSIVMNGEVVERGSGGSSSGSGSSSEEESYIRYFVGGGIIQSSSADSTKTYIISDDVKQDVTGKYGIVKVTADKTISIVNARGCILSVDLSHWNPKNLTSITGAFNALLFIEELDLSHIDTSKIKSFYRAFYGLTNLRRLNISTWDTSNATDFTEMFLGLSNLESLDLRSFNLSKTTKPLNISCKNLKTLYLGRDFFNAPNIENISLNNPNWTDSSVSKSLYMYLYNRKANSQPDLKLTLSDETKAVLTDAQKTRLTDYGYTLA